MASLKEVKSRITSVEGTRKITLARQMVSSARLHRWQNVLENAGVYNDALSGVVGAAVNAMGDFSSPLTDEQVPGPIAIVIMSSNSGMCGSFNAKMIKEFENLPKQYPGREMLFYPIGKKIREAIQHAGHKIEGNFDTMSDKPTFGDAANLVRSLTELFLRKEICRVDVIHYHLKSIGIQEIINKTLLPYQLMPKSEETGSKAETTDYIFEPNQQKLLGKILPKMLNSDFYTMLIDNHTSECAARTVAMQLASENAKDILEDLRMTYNKLRQQSITSELLDIIGGSFA